MREFWEDSDYAREEYVDEPLTDALVASVEAELGFKLPAAYVALMRTQNGGIPLRTCFPTESATSWAEDHIAISGISAIGRTKRYALLGAMGSRFMQEEWGYPTWGVCICNCPSAGHDMVMLDYRDCGPQGEPSVVHVDQEGDYAVTSLAPDFATFLEGLTDESVFDTSENDLEATLETIRRGSFSTSLTALLDASTDQSLRALLAALAKEKGYFALHGDRQSHLVYDVLFDVYAKAGGSDFLGAYESLLAFGDGEITTGGYAPDFLTDWLRDRRAAGQIIEHDGTLRLSDAHAARVHRELAAY